MINFASKIHWIMKINFLKATLFSAAMASCLASMAVKAKPGVSIFIQPDGSTVAISLYGDENFHYATTTDDCLLLFNEEGTLEYAVADINGNPVLSGISASAVRPHSISPIKGTAFAQAIAINPQIKTLASYSSRAENEATDTDTSGKGKYVFSSTAFPVTGTPHSLVILVEYQDYKFSMDNPLEYYQDFLNGDNFKRDGAYGSCRKYYSENSNGLFVPTYDVYGPVPLANNRRYYGGGAESNANKMVVEAVKYLDDAVDFSQYDHNGDGYVDSVYIIYANKGEADGGPSESVWPYSYELEREHVILAADGVRFNTYGCSNEMQADGDMEGIGTFTHEFGHVMGLPDLYNTLNGNDFTTPELWSLMDRGSYNNDCRTPPNLSSFERYSLGWITPEELKYSGNYTLTDLHDTNKAYIISSTTYPDEFFIMDYRKQEGWDEFLPNHGMLIWHIDFMQNSWDRNEVNAIRAHQRVLLVRADNRNTVDSFAGDCFPGDTGQTEFSTATVPPLRTWQYEELNIKAIKDITEFDDHVTFSTFGLTPPASVDAPDSETLGFRLEGNVIFSSSGNFQAYDLTGRLIGTATPASPLPLDHGIYFVGGKKILVK